MGFDMSAEYILPESALAALMPIEFFWWAHLPGAHACVGAVFWCFSPISYLCISVHYLDHLA